MDSGDTMEYICSLTIDYVADEPSYDNIHASDRSRRLCECTKITGADSAGRFVVKTTNLYGLLT